MFLESLNINAHKNFLHPNMIDWNLVNKPEEVDFASQGLFGVPGKGAEAIAYIYKELAQLAEVEFHVASIMLQIIGEGRAERNKLWAGPDLVNAVSCFAAEETQHASTFYKYVRELSGKDITFHDNFYKERVKVYQGDISPLLKLAALCATAYVGESTITVFERRLKLIDPEMKRSFTRLLHLHGLDEARHIKLDHYVFDIVFPSLTSRQRAKVFDIIIQTEELNRKLELEAEKQIQSDFSVDFMSGNPAAELQQSMTEAFRRAAISETSLRHVDDFLAPEMRHLLLEFSGSERVHGD